MFSFNLWNQTNRFVYCTDCLLENQLEKLKGINNKQINEERTQHFVLLTKITCHKLASYSSLKIITYVLI